MLIQVGGVQDVGEQHASFAGGADVEKRGEEGLHDPAAGAGTEDAQRVKGHFGIGGVDDHGTGQGSSPRCPLPLRCAVGDDQLADMVQRRGMEASELKRLVGSNL